MVSALQTPETAPEISSGERRLAAEWALLLELARLNPHRLTDLSFEDGTVRLQLRQTPALRPDGSLADSHRIRIEYPRFFPSMPLELYLDEPMLHPNLHPHTGFICLWETHRISNTAEHALHKTAAILGWQLLNLDPPQVMQPDAAAMALTSLDTLRGRLIAPPLRGLQPSAPVITDPAAPRRKRLV